MDARNVAQKRAHEKFIKQEGEFIEEIRIKNPNVEIIGEYKGRHSPIETKCKICGYIWTPIASSLLRGSSHKNAKSIHKKQKKCESK